MTRKFLTVTLNPSLDKTVVIQKISKQGGYKFQNEMFTAGGKGINVARALKALGHNTAATGFLGGVPGRDIGVKLKKEGIKGFFVSVPVDTRINYTLIDQERVLSTRVFGLEPKITQRDVDLFWKQYKLFLREIDVVIISGKSPKGVSDGFLMQLLKTADQQGLIAILDTDSSALKSGIKAGPFFIKPNLEEAQEVLRRKIDTRSDLKKALVEFHRMGARITVITLGAKGAAGFDGNEFILCSQPAIEIKNDVGCGDAFVAGFISSYLKDRKFSEAVRMGAVCGISSARNLIPGKIEPKKFSKLREQVKIKQFN